MGTYQLQPVCIRVCLHELAEVSVDHPVRYHRELSLGHHYSNQWQDIRMPKRSPRHNLFTEPLHRLCQSAGIRKECTTGNSRPLSSVSQYSSRSLWPLRQRLDRSVLPSTRPQTLPCTLQCRFGGNKRGFSGLSEGVRGDRTSCTTI